MKSIAFVTSLNAGFGSIKIRGIDVSMMFENDIKYNVVFLECKKVKKKYDLYVHVKKPCLNILKHESNNVIDYVDRFENYDFNFSAEIFNNDAHKLSCKSTLCVSIPHHYNNLGLKYPCNISKTRYPLPTVPTIFIPGNTDGNKIFFSKNFLKKYNLVFENKKVCQQYIRSDIILMWNIRKKSHHLKPVERFTNGLPKFTIGSSHYSGLHLLDKDSHKFICEDEECISQLISLYNTSLNFRNTFANMSKRVKILTSPEKVKSTYRNLFDTIFLSKF